MAEEIAVEKVPSPMPVFSAYTSEMTPENFEIQNEEQNSVPLDSSEMNVSNSSNASTERDKDGVPSAHTESPAIVPEKKQISAKMNGKYSFIPLQSSTTIVPSICPGSAAPPEKFVSGGTVVGKQRFYRIYPKFEFRKRKQFAMGSVPFVRRYQDRRFAMGGPPPELDPMRKQPPPPTKRWIQQGVLYDSIPTMRWARTTNDGKRIRIKDREQREYYESVVTDAACGEPGVKPPPAILSPKKPKKERSPSPTPTLDHDYCWQPYSKNDPFQRGSLAPLLLPVSEIVNRYRRKGRSPPLAKDTYECKQCPQTFSDPVLFKKHFQTHITAERTELEKASKAFPVEETTTKAVVTKSKRKATHLSCNICRDVFESEVDLDNHRSTMHPVYPDTSKYEFPGEQRTILPVGAIIRVSPVMLYQEKAQQEDRPPPKPAAKGVPPIEHLFRKIAPNNIPPSRESTFENSTATSENANSSLTAAKGVPPIENLFRKILPKEKPLSRESTVESSTATSESWSANSSFKARRSESTTPDPWEDHTETNFGDYSSALSGIDNAIAELFSTRTYTPEESARITARVLQAPESCSPEPSSISSKKRVRRRSSSSGRWRKVVPSTSTASVIISHSEAWRACRAMDVFLLPPGSYAHTREKNRLCLLRFRKKQKEEKDAIFKRHQEMTEQNLTLKAKVTQLEADVDDMKRELFQQFGVQV